MRGTLPVSLQLSSRVLRRVLLTRVLSSVLSRVLLCAVVVGALASCTSSTSTSSGKPTTLNRPVTDPAPTPLNSPTLARIASSGVVRVGVKFDVPLFGLKDPTTGEVRGFDVEISKMIATALFPKDPHPESHIRFVEALSKNREKLLQSGTVDLIVSTYTINDARKQFVDFAGPYYIAGQDILAKKADIDSGRIRGIGDVADKRVCSVTGSTSLANLRAAAPSADTSITKDKYSECFDALVHGQVDAMTTDDVILLGLASGNPDYAITGNPFHTEPYGIGITKGDVEMRTFVNTVLQHAFDDGRWRNAFESTVGTTGAIAPSPPQLDR